MRVVIQAWHAQLQTSAAISAPPLLIAQVSEVKILCENKRSAHRYTPLHSGEHPTPAKPQHLTKYQQLQSSVNVLQEIEMELRAYKL